MANREHCYSCKCYEEEIRAKDNGEHACCAFFIDGMILSDNFDSFDCEHFISKD